MSEEYSQANGEKCEFLWDSKYEAPEFKVGKNYSEDDFNAMVVWNLGSILLDLVIGSHKLSTLDIANKFKDEPFSFKAIGISDSISEKFSNELTKLLARMLHYNP